jgi:hypothetical protein
VGSAWPGITIGEAGSSPLDRPAPERAHSLRLHS